MKNLGISKKNLVSTRFIQRIEPWWYPFTFKVQYQRGLILKRSLTVLVPILFCLFLASCTKQYSITTPTSNSSNPSSGGGNPNGPVIDAGVMRMTSITSGAWPVTTITTQCQVLIESPPPNAGPLAATGVTLIAPGNVHILVAPVTTGTYMDPGNGWTYQPGQTYTIQAMIAGTLYSATVVAPGNITIPDFPSPGPIVWSFAGNHDTITIVNPSYTTTLIGPLPPATSGQVSTASSTYFSNSGNYTITVSALQQNPGAFGPNAYTTNLINATDMYNLTTTK